MFAIDPADPVPIWRQIEEGVRRLINLGALHPGAAVPSMRDLAHQPSQPNKSERNEALRDGAMRYAGTAIAVGVELDDAVDELEAAFARLTREHRRAPS
jgi:hypothetical protein